MLFILLPFTYCEYLVFHHHYYYNDLQRCSKASTHYILNLRISFEQQALIALQEFLGNEMNIPIDYLAAARTYFTPIFQSINTELEPYGIHIRPDFGQLIIENFPFEWDKTQCSNDGIVPERVEIAKEYFEATSVHGIGNRLLILYCYETMDKQMSYITKIGDCGHILGMLFHEPHMFKIDLKDEIIKLFSGGNRSDNINITEFNHLLCGYVHRCVSEIGNLIGEYVSNAKNIKDINDINFLMPVDSRVRVHSVYDDVAFDGPYHGDRRLYPIDDYCIAGYDYIPLARN